MKTITLKKISVDDIYVSILTARRTTNKEGWTRMEPVDKTLKPTGSLIMDAIAQALNENCSLTATDIAKMLQCEAKKLNAAFSLLTGMELRTFLKMFKLKRACEWLTCTDVEAQEVAKRSGFTSPQAFNDFFKKQMKCTANQYRKLHRPSDFRELYAY